MTKRTLLILAALLSLTLSGCVALPDRSHNAAGGYADACGELPPLLGDDC